ncbi:unnamed protein product [Cylindrotheca closterium]|uniref:SAP domain-containing protein n=1 Tax=Cylindrotheca closterium TaxID=2856 RepID=A0AAD2CJ16_9STRA|nr:unnamed protein product [Cylindrotheca closterium]
MKATLFSLCAYQLLAPGIAFFPTSSAISKSSPALVLMENSNIVDMEKEVMASARLKMDKKRVVSALDKDKASKEDPQKTALLASTWQISAAAGISAFIGCECVTHSNFLSVLVLTAAVFSAWRDPVDDEGLLGAISRLLGRATIQTVESSKPRLQRIARAAIMDDGDEDYFKTTAGRQTLADPRLAQYIEDLEKDNTSLSLWKERRELVDQYLSYYSLDDLQSKARERGIDTNCRKAQLMMKLVEADIIQLH